MAAQRWQTPLTMDLQTEPGPVGFTLGEKEFPPPDPIAFSVGVTAGGLELDGVTFELVAGASFSVVGLHPARAPTASRAAPPPRMILRVIPVLMR
jgi:hypothetical protein